MDALKILMVDDEERMRKLVKDFLTNKGFSVVEAGDGEEAVDKFYENKDIALILLDVMMPKMDGWEVVREIRKYSQVPIIMLTAKGDTIDKVLGLELGADDYIVKPFEAKEMVARVKAVLRRFDTGKAEKENSKILKYENLEINMENYTVKYHGEFLSFPPKEFELLYFLAKRPNQVFTRDQLLDKIWGYDSEAEFNVVWVYISYLRKKLSSLHAHVQIKATRGVGYSLIE